MYHCSSQLQIIECAWDGRYIYTDECTHTHIYIYIYIYIYSGGHKLGNGTTNT